jgi:hypothetical protein
VTRVVGAKSLDGTVVETRDVGDKERGKGEEVRDRRSEVEAAGVDAETNEDWGGTKLGSSSK